MSTIESYRLVENLGIVPRGRAYRAVDTRSETRVLLKVIPPSEQEPKPGKDARPWEELVAETRRLEGLSHPAVPELHEVAESDKGLLVAWAPATGRTLRQYLAEGGHLDRPTLAAWCETLLSALGAAHNRGVVHRHLGEDTVTVAADGGVLVTGFALTQAVFEQPETQAPEQLQDQPATAASDLYAVGSLMQRISSGVLAGGDPLMAVFEKSASRHAEERHATAAAMLAAVEEAVTRPAPPVARQAAAPPAPDPGSPAPEPVEPKAPEPAQPAAAMRETPRGPAAQAAAGGGEAGPGAGKPPIPASVAPPGAGLATVRIDLREELAAAHRAKEEEVEDLFAAAPGDSAGGGEDRPQRPPVPGEPGLGAEASLQGATAGAPGEEAEDAREPGSEPPAGSEAGAEETEEGPAREPAAPSEGGRPGKSRWTTWLLLVLALLMLLAATVLALWRFAPETLERFFPQAAAPAGEQPATTGLPAPFPGPRSPDPAASPALDPDRAGSLAEA